MPSPLPENAPPGFHLLAKPSGSTCNIDCSYCFFLSKEALYPNDRHRMSEATLEAYIRQLLESHRVPQVTVAWQGGEPTLMKLDFFRRSIELVEKYRRPGQTVQHTFQTNGLLIDDDWCVFFKQHDFLVGLSCDGPQRLHDRYRPTKGGTPTHDKVVAAARLLKKHGVPFNALCVVNRENAKFPLDVYRFLTRELGAWRIQLIACVEPKVFRDVAPQRWDLVQLPLVGTPQAAPGAPDSVVTDWSVDPQDWGAFLCKMWDDWYSRDDGKVHVDLFETAIAQSLGIPAQRCITAEFCGKALAVEHDGHVYSCDHYVYPEYRLGNLHQTHWGEMAYSERQQAFGFAKRDTLPQYCRDCEHLKLCWGECPKNRLVRTPSGEAGLNYLCSGLKRFYGHIQLDMPQILRRVQAGRRSHT